MMKRLSREPLVHFLILGALLLFASNFVKKRTSGDTRKIVITQGQIEHLEDDVAAGKVHFTKKEMDQIAQLEQRRLQNEQALLKLRGKDLLKG